MERPIVRLSEFDISFERKGHIKAQALVDFITKLAPHPGSEGREWFLSIDGASNQSRSGIGVILEGHDEVLVEQSLWFEFKANNNQVEYEALLVEDEVGQRTRCPGFNSQKRFEAGHKPSKWKATVEEQGVCCVETKKTWMDPFLEYFKRDIVPNDTTQARKLIREASKYTLVGEHLYRRGFSFPLLKCLDTDEAEYIMREVHEGDCGSHIGGRAIASKVAKVDYFTKWVEAEPIATISVERETFLLEEWYAIRFSIGSRLLLIAKNPVVIHFSRASLVKWASRGGQQGHFERVAKMVGRDKGKMGRRAPQVLLSYRTTPHSPTNETPFCLTFGIEAMIPVEIGEPSPQTTLF
ncbi:hypothetical protein CR513_01709, partial [Mucuna pruriens]